MAYGTDQRHLPTPSLDSAIDWVAEHLGDLFQHESDRPLARPDAPPSAVDQQPIRGGQEAADQALALTSLTGYARFRNEVLPVNRRGATRLSPYIRHGLLTLERVWQTCADAPEQDRVSFRQELLWQEYARHFYARMGTATGDAMRYRLPDQAVGASDGWPEGLACVDQAVAELQATGWLTNQQRMWLASHWSVRLGWDWRRGEDLFFAQLLDGSRAANRIGWQWTAGALTGKPYGFSQWQVKKRAPQLCRTCAWESACPIEQWPDDRDAIARDDVDPRLRQDFDLGHTMGPTATQMVEAREPKAVWITAESLGDDDPAMSAHPDLPVHFMWDVPLLRRLRLSPNRARFLAECLADLSGRRELHVWRGDPNVQWLIEPVATTFAPVPGWRERAGVLDITRVHPWPWLTQPHAGPIQSFTAWHKKIRGRGSQP